MNDTLSFFLTILSISILLVAIRLLNQVHSNANADIAKRMREKRVLMVTAGGMLLLDLLYCAAAIGLLRGFDGLAASTVGMVIAACALLVAAWIVRSTLNVLGIYSRFQQECMTDPLTGLDNRRSLERRLSDEVARSARYKTPLCVLVVDVDHFKVVNDTYGHAAGDQVLVELGKRLKGAMRDTDFCARAGGEEFVVVAPNTDPIGVLVFGERIRAMIAEMVMEVTGGEHVWLTASIGVSNLGLGENDHKALLERADKAMYAAKHDGRNRVRVQCAPEKSLAHSVLGVAA